MYKACGPVPATDMAMGLVIIPREGVWGSVRGAARPPLSRPEEMRVLGVGNKLHSYPNPTTVLLPCTPSKLLGRSCVVGPRTVISCLPGPGKGTDPSASTAGHGRPL